MAKFPKGRFKLEAVQRCQPFNYSFNISGYAVLLLSIAYPTKDEADEAHAKIAEALEKAVEVGQPGRVARSWPRSLRGRPCGDSVAIDERFRPACAIEKAQPETRIFARTAHYPTGQGRPPSIVALRAACRASCVTPRLQPNQGTGAPQGCLVFLWVTSPNFFLTRQCSFLSQ